MVGIGLRKMQTAMSRISRAILTQVGIEAAQAESIGCQLDKRHKHKGN